jgi:hypothetical protein
MNLIISQKLKDATVMKSIYPPSVPSYRQTCNHLQFSPIQIIRLLNTPHPYFKKCSKLQRKLVPQNKKKKTSLISPQYENPPPPIIEADYVPTSNPPLPPPQDNLHNVQIGKLCQDYAKIIKEIKTTMAPL